MKKVLTLIAIFCMAMILLTGCFDPTPACEHDWTDATCTAPKTCSLCDATEGEPLGHTEETIAGTPATCTDAGMTDGQKCTVCGETTVQQTVIAAKGHTEETVAGQAATCTEAGMTDGKKCSVCGVTTLEQSVIEALGHKAGEDDGDVTTAVTCERCDHVFVEAKEAITLTIPNFENGAVIADKINYAIGDTVKLTINPDFGYAQKLYINGEALILDWNNNVYTFVAEKDTYVISGSFELVLDMAAGDVTRWDYSNQAHGIVTTYYPNNNDAWWFQIKGNYESFSINAKNYREVENSYENGPDGGWRIALYMKLDNGNYYAFSMWIDTSKIYAYQHFGGKIAGDKDSTTGWSGAWRNLAEWNAEATAALNGNGAEFKLERIDGNHIQVTFGGVVLETYEISGVTAENKVVAVGLHHWGNKGSYVEIPFAVTEACEHTWDAATCTTPKTCSKCGETMGKELGHSYTNYTSNNDATCTVDGTKTAQCDNCTEKNTIVDAGSAGHKNNNDDYKCDVCGANLCTDHKPEADDGDCTTAVKCSICGTITTEAKGSHTPEADDGNIATEVKCSNDGCDHICVPAIVISTFENGTVTADKTSYKVGDTVTLTVSPAKDYAQKLYINGAPILVDTNSKYSFVVEAGKTYDITGEFVNVKGDWFWTAEYIVLNQAHGVFHSPIPAGGEKNGELVPTADKCYGGKVLVKDPSGGTKTDFAIVLKMIFSDGQKAELRLVNKDGKGHYMIQSMSGMFGSWKWYYDLNDAENAAVANGEGVWFELVRDGSNIDIKLNGKVISHRADTPISLAETTVLNQFKVTTYNFSYAIDVKYEFYMTE